MYLVKNKIYPLNNMHFSYQEAFYECYERLRKDSFKLRCSVIVITTAQRHPARDVSVKVSDNGTAGK